MRRYRVAHVMHWPTVAGTEVATLRMVQALSPKEFAPIAFCAHQQSETSRFFSAAGVDIAPYRVPDLSFRRPVPFLVASLQFGRSLKRAAANIVHCSDVTAAFYATLAARFARLPVICHVRNPDEAIPRRYQTILRAVSRFIFVSQHARNHFAWEIAETRGAVIYDGYDGVEIPHSDASRAVRAEFGIPSECRLIGMAARLAPQKDHATFVRAACSLLAGDHTLHFLIIGDHSDTPESIRYYRDVMRLTADLNLTAHFTFTGFRHDVAQLLAGMDVVVLATHFEGFGLVLLEAMAHGRPVVATSVGGILEFVRHQETGLLHRHGDAEHLASQIRVLLRDEEYAHRLGEAGRHLVRTDFGMNRFSQRISGLYHVLLRSG